MPRANLYAFRGGKLRDLRFLRLSTSGYVRLGNCGCTSSQECEQSLGTGAVCANICANTSCAQGPGGVTQPVCTKRSPTTVCL
jgi:hypothetical protein